MTTIDEIRNSFWEILGNHLPELAKQRDKKKSHFDYRLDIRVAFNDHVIDLLDRGVISEELAENAEL